MTALVKSSFTVIFCHKIFAPIWRTFESKNANFFRFSHHVCQESHIRFWIKECLLTHMAIRPHVTWGLIIV